MVDVPKDPDPYNGGIQLPSGWRVWGDVAAYADADFKTPSRIDITYENRTTGELRYPRLDSIRVVDDQGNAYTCTNMNPSSNFSSMPAGSHGFSSFSLDHPKPGFQWLRIEVPAIVFQGEGTLGFKVSAATLDKRNEFVRKFNR